MAPFARVLVVVEGGPAEGAGVKQGDLVARFGSVTKENFTGTVLRCARFIYILV